MMGCAIALTIGPYRRRLVVVGRLRFQTLHARPKNRLRVAAVEPDMESVNNFRHTRPGSGNQRLPSVRVTKSDAV